MTQNQELLPTAAGSGGSLHGPGAPTAEQPLGYFIFHPATETISRIADFLLQHDVTRTMGQSLEAIVKITRQAPMRDHPRLQPPETRCPFCEDSLITQMERYNNVCVTCQRESLAST